MNETRQARVQRALIQRPVASLTFCSASEPAHVRDLMPSSVSSAAHGESCRGRAAFAGCQAQL